MLEGNSAARPFGGEGRQRPRKARMSDRNPGQKVPRTEQERLLRGRLLGRRVELLDGRHGILLLVWHDPITRGLSCCIQLQGASTWIDASEIRIPLGGSAA
jgi:hypothetical protein